MSITLNQKKILLVEGKEEKFFMSAIFDYLKLTDIQVLDYGGKSRLRPFIKALTITAGFSNVRSLAVTRDADTNAVGAFQSVRDALRNAGLPSPSSNLTKAGSKPSVTVMIIPNGKDPGMLEDLCLESVSNDPAMVCIDQYFDCIKTELKNLPNNISKARIHTFLASREKPDLRVGEAAQQGYWPWKSFVFDQLKRFLLAI